MPAFQRTGKKVESALPRRALTVDEYCRSYGGSRSRAFKMIASGELRSVLVGGRRLIPIDAAEALLNPEK